MQNGNTHRAPPNWTTNYLFSILSRFKSLFRVISHHPLSWQSAGLATNAPKNPQADTIALSSPPVVAGCVWPRCSASNAGVKRAKEGRKEASERTTRASRASPHWAFVRFRVLIHCSNAMLVFKGHKRSRRWMYNTHRRMMGGESAWFDSLVGTDATSPVRYEHEYRPQATFTLQYTRIFA